MRKPRHPISGLSQLEVLIALAIMGLITVVLANALSFTGRLLQRTIPLSQQVEHALARDTLRRWAEDMPLSYRAEPGRLAVLGTQNSLTLRTLIHDGTFWGGAVSTVKLAALDGDLRVDVNGTEDQTGTPVERTLILATEVQNLSIQYFGIHDEEPRTGWHREWKVAVGLPDLIKIEWETKDGRPAPPLTLRPAKTDLDSYIELSDVLPKR